MSSWHCPSLRARRKSALSCLAEWSAWGLHLAAAGLACAPCVTATVSPGVRRPRRLRGRCGYGTNAFALSGAAVQCHVKTPARVNFRRNVILMRDVRL
eukprot:scaffold3422_cov77-Phaeocystis_antarctica.AAC.1